MNKTSSYRDSLLAALVDPEEAMHYLNAALEDSQEAFLVAMKNVAQARKMTTVAKESGIQRETLYRSLSEDGNPTLDTLSSVLHVYGLKIIISEISEESGEAKIPAPTSFVEKSYGGATETPAASMVHYFYAPSSFETQLLNDQDAIGLIAKDRKSQASQGRDMNQSREFDHIATMNGNTVLGDSPWLQ